jgi:hypothetical protein
MNQIEKRRWTEEEIAKLRELYPIASRNEICNTLKRSWVAIALKAMNLGLKRPHINERLIQRLRSAQPPKLNEFDIGFLVGMIEGEGWIGIAGQIRGRKAGVAFKFTPRLSIVNTQLSLLKKCMEITGMGKIWKSTYKRSSVERERYQWVIWNRIDLYRLLKMLIPYLITKKRQAELVVKFIELRAAQPHWVVKKDNNGRILSHYGAQKLTEEQKEIIRELHRLNARGVFKGRHSKYQELRELRS